MAARSLGGTRMDQGTHTERPAIGVVGLGMTGLPLAGAFRDAGRRVLGFESDPARRAAVEAGDGDALGVPAERWFGSSGAQRSDGRGSFDVATDLERVAECEALFLCLPTPLDADGAPDLSAIESAAHGLAPHLAPNALVVLCSTTWPGTTEQRLVPWLHEAGPRRLGRDLCVAYSPEREDPGSGRRTREVPRLVGGMDSVSLERARALLAEALDTVHSVESCATAESAKLLENVFRAVNIALVNEFKQVLDAQGIDVWPVVRAAATKPYGFMPFEPGPGLGGHCIPVDPEYLTWAARRAGVPATLVELALDVNRDLPRRVVSKLSEALDLRGSQLEGARVLVLGAAYKPGVADTRESPGLRIMELCESAGARCDYADSFVPRLAGDVPESLVGRASVELGALDLAAYDAVVLAVHHPGVDLAPVAESARLIVDTRDGFRGFDLPPERLVRA
jgi:UDP-N-acetyl-D-glucosamine dehydrogenase